jgi:multidrug resistance efflux pump
MMRMTPSEILTTTSPIATSRRLPGLLVCAALFAGTGVAWVLERSGLQSFPGAIAARTTVVTSHRAARVDAVSIKTGQTVVPGDPLFQLIDAQLEDRIVSKRREIVSLESEVARARGSADVELAWRQRELQAEIFQTQLKEAAFSQEKLNKQVEQIAWKERLNSFDPSMGPALAEADHPFRSISLDLRLPDDRRLQAMLREDAAAASAEALSTQVALCEQRLKKLAALEKELESKLRASSGVDVAEARLNSAKQELVALDSQSRELALESPTYGTISEVQLQSGDRVPQGAALVEILDDRQPHVVAHVPTAIASRLRHGAKVDIVFPTHEKRIGIIAMIPPQTISMAGKSESFVAVKVEPAGKLWPKLPLGSHVNVVFP